MRRLALSRFSRSAGSLAAVLAVASAVLGLYACGNGDDGDDTTKDGGTSSDSGSKDATTPGSDATTPGTDAASGTDASPSGDSSSLTDGNAPGTDGGGDGGGGDSGTVGQLGSCGTPFIVDTSASAVSEDLWAESFNGKWAIGWVQNDANEHMKVRYFDGTTMQPEIDLGAIAVQNTVSAVDTSGVAYVIGFGHTSLTTFRSAFDLVAGESIATTNVASRLDDNTSFSVASLVHGALAVYQGTTTGEVGDLSTSGTAWSNDGSYPPGSVEPVDGPTTFTHVALNAAGKGGASWSETLTGDGRRLFVSGFDGTRLGTPVTRDFPAATNGAPEYLTSAALSNGDLAFVWSSASLAGVTFATFHVASGTWDPDMVIDTFTGADISTIPQILADDDDDLTILWTRPSANVAHPLVALRRIGGTWGSILSLGLTPQPVRAALDPNGNVVIPVLNDTVPSVTRIAAKGTTFDPLVPTGLPTVNEFPALATVFSANGDPVIVDFGQFDGGAHVVAVNCTTRP